MALQPGYYWYKGPSVRDGEVNHNAEAEWTIVDVHDYGVCYMGLDWDGSDEDLALMEKLGRFVPINPPTE